MTSAMAVFGAAVGGTSLVCYLLMTRLRKRSADRGPAGDSSGAEGGDDTGGGLRFSNWFGGDNASLDSSGNPTHSGGGHSRGGGEGGGGRDGTGGGCHAVVRRPWGAVGA